MLIIFIVNKKDTRTPIFFVIFEHIFLVFLSLTLNKQVRVTQEIRLREIRLKNINPRQNKNRCFNSQVYYDYFYLISLEIKD